MTRIVSASYGYALESIRAPTLVISVRDDLFGTYASAQYTAQQIAGARFLGFERGGHVWVGHQAEVVEQSAAFMRNALAATRVVRCDAAAPVRPAMSGVPQPCERCYRQRSVASAAPSSATRFASRDRRLQSGLLRAGKITR